MKRFFAALALTIAASVVQAHDLGQEGLAELEVVDTTRFEVLHSMATAAFYECKDCDTKQAISLFLLPVSDPAMVGAASVLDGSMAPEDRQASCRSECDVRLIEVGGETVLEDVTLVDDGTTPAFYQVSRSVRHGDRILEIFASARLRDDAVANNDAVLGRVLEHLGAAHPAD